MECSEGGLFKGCVWPGICVFPDLLRKRVRAWWASLIADSLLRHGISGLWLDMNEPAIFYMMHEVRRLCRKVCGSASHRDWEVAGRLLREAVARISTYGYPWLGRQDVKATHHLPGEGKVQHRRFTTFTDFLKLWRRLKHSRRLLREKGPSC